MKLNFPLHFAPYLKSVIWGGNRLAAYKGITTNLTSIGESWEISAVPGHVSIVDVGPLKGMSLNDLMKQYGPELVGKDVYNRTGDQFPLMIKILDSGKDLSLQVHPDDETAWKKHGCPGKTEMWRVIETRPGAKLYVGFNRQITLEEYENRVANNSIMDVICEYETSPGDSFFIPAGRIHAIGAGNLIAEVEQTSDITYRIYDFGRLDNDGKLRDLHTVDASRVLDYTVKDCYKTPSGAKKLADCKYFSVKEFSLNKTVQPLNDGRNTFTAIMCLMGNAKIEYAENENQVHRVQYIRQGDTWLFPATLSSIKASNISTILLVQV